MPNEDESRMIEYLPTEKPRGRVRDIGRDIHCGYLFGSLPTSAIEPSFEKCNMIGVAVELLLDF